ncbi:MAG: Mrp/NBP35 family ATP-binding protein [Gemmatimonadota bacterium]|jgi:ATP-binding protein involved in chromosome partitioning
MTVAGQLSEKERKQLYEEHERRIQAALDQIDNRVVVFSGKGGVGKTTVAVNLAYAMEMREKRVGLLDADITGPNIGKMIGMSGPFRGEDGRIFPHDQGGVKAVSIAPMILPGEPVIWRGPLRAKALEQFLSGVEWGELDFLIADLPPGTGDEVLTMTQRTSPQVAIIVTSPQELSLIDSHRAVNMAKQMEIPHIGIVENMSGFICHHCGEEIPLFGSGGGARQARELGVQFLGSIPIDLEVPRCGDAGRPIVLNAEGGPVAEAFMGLASSVCEMLET